MIKIDRCPYCGGKVRFADSKEIYGKSFGMVYICSNFPRCDSYVGVHKETNNPKGTLANRELRKLRSQAHFYFDPTWRHNFFISRYSAYQWLSSELKIHVGDCHIGLFNLDLCKKTIELCKPITEYLLNKKFKKT